MNNFKEAIFYLKEELPKIERLESAILHGSARNLIEDYPESKFSINSDIDLIVLVSGGPKLCEVHEQVSDLYKDVCEKYELYDVYPGNKLAKLDLVLLDDFIIKTQLYNATNAFKKYLSKQPTLFGENFAELIGSKPLSSDLIPPDQAYPLAQAIRRLRRASVTLEFYYEHSPLMFDWLCHDRVMGCAKTFYYSDCVLAKDVTMGFKEITDREAKKLQVELLVDSLEESLLSLK